MKKSIVVGALGIGIAAVATVLYVFFGTTTPVVQKSDTETPAATATTLKKELSVTAAGQSAARAIADSASVSQGDVLTTSHDGRGLVTMSNGSTAVLEYDSSMQIDGLDPSGTHTSLSLVTGRVWAQVQKVLGEGEYFEIKTHNAVAVVRGTSFGLTSKKDGSSELWVGRGTVALIPMDPATGRRNDDKAISVTAGKKGIVFANGSTTESDLSKDDTSSDWYVSNMSEASPDVPSSSDTSTATPTTDTQTESPANPSTPNTPTTKTGTQSGSAAAAPADDNACASFSDSGAGANTKGSLTLLSVSPASVGQNSQDSITLKGTGFECVIEIDVGGKALVQSDTGEIDYTIVDNSTITIPADVLPVGRWDVTMLDTMDNRVTLQKSLTVTQ